MKISVVSCAIVFICCAISIASASVIKGTVIAHGQKNGANAVISIGSIPGQRFPAPKEHVAMNQKKLTFVPHILPVLVGSTVEFQNNDNVLHNVYAGDGSPESFNVLGWPKQPPPMHVFTQGKAVTKLLCGYHPDMLGFIVPVETPYFAVSGTDGNYTIPNVPAGHYTLKIWHEKLPAATRVIDVGESGETIVNWELAK